MAEISQQPDLHVPSPPEQDAEEPLPFRAFTRRRLLAGASVLLAVLLLAVVPPLFNVSRYKRQIAFSIGQSLGRPVHIDNVTLTLLPLPGFTLERFVVGEDPAFGAEPVLRADEVQATVRFGSLWRRRLEFSRIKLTDPSINLVHLPDGRWNLESILVQAARMPAAPTAQRSPGDTPRFPYIEATGARINLKQGVEKTPFSVTEADTALWLPEPGQWHLRLKARPTRTDTAVSDTGTLRLDGTLGQASALGAVPLELHADWTSAPLGALSLILMGRDAGMRGVMNLHATVQGRVGDNRISTALQLENVRRSDFVPHRSLSASLNCTAHTLQFFQVIEAAHCTWPGETDGSGLTADFRIPDVWQPASARGSVQLRDVPLAGLLDALRVASNRVSPELAATGLLSADLTCCDQPAAPQSAQQPEAAPALVVPEATLFLQDEPPFLHARLSAVSSPTTWPGLSFAPIPLDLGGPKPALFALQLNARGATMQLTGEAAPAQVRRLVRALPQFGDGLPEALGLPSTPAPGPEPSLQADVQGEHLWTGGQTWTPVARPAPPVRGGNSARRRKR